MENTQEEQTAPECHIDAGEEMTVAHAQQLKPFLMERLKLCQNLDVNLSGVTEFDTAGVQLLILLKKEAMAYGKKVEFTSCSPAVKRVVELYKLSDFLGI
jgi:anti-sigma B factor antagonist